MTTQALKLNTKINSRINSGIINNNDLYNRIFHTILYTVGFLALCYVLILSNIVWNIVARKNAQSQARVLSTEVSTLELNYLSLSDKIDLNLAHSLGFKEVSKSYATRKNIGSLAILQNEL